ncbi:MAG: TonB-dependent receptor [Gammaproteobacteria bacterium]|nr:MAG: TonB-dependent receptor [Gammaproteobacteria bacterium]
MQQHSSNRSSYGSRSAALTVAVAGILATPLSDLAYAQEGGARLDEVVVTAQRREQSLQEIPVAVSAFTGEELVNRGVFETSDLMGALPNLQVTSAYSSTQPNFSLRGISVANEFSASTASPVGVYVDEVYQSFRASHGQQLFDLERIEVLRGPQGTLYGRNTTGGAVNFITRRPELAENNGYATVGYGTFSAVRLLGAAEFTAVPDVFGIRVAGTYVHDDGYIKNPTLGKTYAQTDSKAVRLRARWLPGDRTDIDLKLYHAYNNPRGDLPFGIGYLEGRTDALGYSRFEPRPELGGRVLSDKEVQSETGNRYFTSSTGGSLTIQHEFDAFTLTSITGFDTSEYRLSPFDCDGSPFDTCSIRYFSESDNFNQDLRIDYQGERLRVLAGAYYGVDRIDTENDADFFGFLRPLLLEAGVPGGFNNIPIAVGNSLSVLPAFLLDPTLTPADPGFCAPVTVNPAGYFDARSLIAFNADVALNNAAGPGPIQAACQAAGAPPFGPILANQQFRLERPSFALYGELGYDLTDRLSVTTGLRITRDSVRYRNARTELFDLSGTTAFASLVPFSFPLDPDSGRVNQSESTTEVTGRIIFDYELADEVLVYAGYSRGYRAGTYNGLAYQDISQVYFVEPEKVDAFEAGMKSRFLDGRLQLNLAGFYYDYTNQQIAQIIGATSFLRNADGRVFGGEAELAWRVSDQVRLDAALGLLDTKYTGNTIDPEDPTSLTLNINGNPFSNAPEVTFSAGVDWRLWSAGNGELLLRTDAQYMGKYYFDPFKDYGQSPCDQPAPGNSVLLATPELACGNPGYWLFNARLSYVTDRFSVSLWGKNLTDKFYYAYGLNLNAFYLDYLSRGAPRTYGAEFSYFF